MAQVKPKQSKQGKQASGAKKVNEGEKKIETNNHFKHDFQLRLNTPSPSLLLSLSLFVDRAREEQRTTEKE